MVVVSVDLRNPHHLNRGIYDVTDVAALIGQPRSRVERWISEDAVHGRPEFDAHFSFLDLISLLTVAELRSREVTEKRIAAGRSYLTQTLRTPWPFAHERLATVGRQFFAAVDADAEWVDVGLGGQLAFDQMLESELRLIEYGDDELAARWCPAKEVVIDPAIQAGTPCVTGSRVSTALIFELAEDGESLERVADDYQLEVTQVRAAIEFEKSLTKTP